MEIWGYWLETWHQKIQICTSKAVGLNVTDEICNLMSSHSKWAWLPYVELVRAYWYLVQDEGAI